MVNAAAGALTMAAAGAGAVDFAANLIIGPRMPMAQPALWPGLQELELPGDENPAPVPTLPGHERSPVTVNGYRSPFNEPVGPNDW